MDALRASYANSCSDSESDSDTPRPTNENHQASGSLPPPPLALLSPPNSLGELNYSQTAQSGRVRSFPHVEGNYALHVFIPGSLGEDFDGYQLMKRVLANRHSLCMVKDKLAFHLVIHWITA